MKALPLWQPWASLVAVGAKRVETRHWRAPASLIGQRIAIHATKTRRELWICEQPAFKRALGTMDMWFGAVIATAVIDRCERMTQQSIDAQPYQELAFGDWSVGRFAWYLRDVEHLAEPVLFTGRQGIFDVPDELLGLQPIAPAQGSLL